MTSTTRQRAHGANDSWLSRLFSSLRVSLSLIVASLVLALPLSASAQEPVVSAPQDAPFLIAPHQNVIPAVPATFETRLEGGWLTLAYPREYHDRMDALVPELVATRDRLAEELGRPAISRVEIRVARDPQEMARVAPEGAPPFSYASGMAYGPLHLITVSLVAPQGSDAIHLEETLRHELVHIAVFDGFGQGTVPRWFNEGLAVKLSGELAIERIETLRTASLAGTLIPFTEMDRKFFGDPAEVKLAYAQSADFVRFLSRRDDHPRFVSMLDRVGQGQAFDAAMTDAYGSDLRKLEFQWKKDLAKRIPIWSIIGGSLVSVLMVVLFAMAWWKRRKASRETLARWEEEESQMDAVIRQIEAATQEAPEPLPVPPQKLPKVEHGGSWHTLH